MIERRGTLLSDTQEEFESEEDMLSNQQKRRLSHLSGEKPRRSTGKRRSTNESIGSGKGVVGPKLRTSSEEEEDSENNDLQTEIKRGQSSERSMENEDLDVGNEHQKAKNIADRRSFFTQQQ